MSTGNPLMINSILVLTPVLLSVAFVTLMERKVMGLTHFRVGPNKTGYQGLMQPFSDAIKLFTKETQKLKKTNHYTLSIAPAAILLMYLMVWVTLPTASSKTCVSLSFMLFIVLISVSIFFLIASGWSSNSKYSLLGSYRATAQTISYEITLLVLILPFVLALNMLNMDFNMSNTSPSMWIMLFMMFPVWVSNLLAETNRTPFDLSESESELVSGFNTEYGGGGFSVIFIAEYTAIIIMSLVCSLIFWKQGLSLPFITLMITFLFIWVRVTLPRIRYDSLMYLSWKYFMTPAVFILSLTVTLLTII